LKDEGGIVVQQELVDCELYYVSDEQVDLVTEPMTGLNQNANAFVAYGNQAVLNYIYGDLVLIVRVGA
jgi:hypothetical protein